MLLAQQFSFQSQNAIAGNRILVAFIDVQLVTRRPTGQVRTYFVKQKTPVFWLRSAKKPLTLQLISEYLYLSGSECARRCIGYAVKNVALHDLLS